jgi:hypothetical protein
VSRGDHSGESATLVINSDESYCSACGGGAAPEEEAHMSIQPREVAGGFIAQGQRAGCGATFIATATESFMPGIAERIREMRPDLPFMGVHGIEGRA